MDPARPSCTPHGWGRGKGTGRQARGGECGGHGRRGARVTPKTLPWSIDFTPLARGGGTVTSGGSPSSSGRAAAGWPPGRRVHCGAAARRGMLGCHAHAAAMPAPSGTRARGRPVPRAHGAVGARPAPLRRRPAPAHLRTCLIRFMLFFTCRARAAPAARAASRRWGCAASCAGRALHTRPRGGQHSPSSRLSSPTPHTPTPTLWCRSLYASAEDFPLCHCSCVASRLRSLRHTYLGQEGMGAGGGEGGGAGRRLGRGAGPARAARAGRAGAAAGRQARRCRRRRAPLRARPPSRPPELVEVLP
jgi:hypothetical protein